MDQFPQTSGAYGQRLDVLEQFSKRARCTGTTRLLSVDIIHGGVPVYCVSAIHEEYLLLQSGSLHPHSERETVVYPRRCLKYSKFFSCYVHGHCLFAAAYRSDQIRDVYLEQDDVSQDEEEAQQGHKIGRQPERQ